MAQRQRESIGRVRPWRLFESERVPDHEGDLPLLGPPVPDDGGLDSCRLQLDHLAAPPAESGQQRAAGLGESERRLGETPEKWRLHNRDVGRDAAQELLELIRQRRERGGPGVRTPRRQTAELDGGYAAGIAFEEPPARDPGAGVEAEDAGQLS